MDDSIIDVSNEACVIQPDPIGPTAGKLTKLPEGVPFWLHKYVFGAYEINYATPEQQYFYARFKSRFLNGECVDIEGNTNYVFVLLFELLNEYKEHQDISLLEQQIRLLVDHYPVCRSYALSYLVKLIAEKESQRDTLFNEVASFVIRGQRASIKAIEEMFSLPYHRAVELMEQLEEAGVVASYNDSPFRQVLMTNIFQIRPAMREETEARLIDEFPDFYWTLSQRYAKQLNLTRKEKRILDQVRISDNSFNTIEFLRLAVIRLFLAATEKLSAYYGMFNSSLALQMHAQADLIARKHFRYRLHSRNYNAFLQSASTEQYTALFRICENEARQYYGHKRKLPIPLFCSHPQIVALFGENMFDKFRTFVKEELPSLPVLSETLEIELNAQNTTRWKEKFTSLSASISSGDNFLADVLELGRLNQLNPSLDLLYFEASKTIAKTDKVVSLILYLYYLDTELRSQLFSYKQLSKTLRKNLFRTEEQVSDFEAIIAHMIETRNLSEAIEAVKILYQPKRKRIHINRGHIQQVRQHHAETVNLLNKYLQDDDEQAETAELTLSLPIPAVALNLASRYIVNLNEMQQNVLHLFEKNNFNIPQQDFVSFAKEKGYFANQLLESINEVCYEELDDLLIEEEEECYRMNKEYYQHILAS